MHLPAKLVLLDALSVYVAWCLGHSLAWLVAYHKGRTSLARLPQELKAALIRRWCQNLFIAAPLFFVVDSYVRNRVIIPGLETRHGHNYVWNDNWFLFGGVEADQPTKEATKQLCLSFVVQQIGTIMAGEGFHYALHRAMHVKGWWGHTLHREHHIVDAKYGDYDDNFTHPMHAFSNHPLDFVTAVLGSVLIGSMILFNFIVDIVPGMQNQLLCETLARILTFGGIGFVGTSVHSNCLLIWQLDMHQEHHKTQMKNFGAYLPFWDVIFGTWKWPEPYIPVNTKRCPKESQKDM